MYRRLALGLGACSSGTIVVMTTPIAFAAEKPSFPPVYDDEVRFNPAPLAGSIHESKPQDTKLAEVETRIGQQLDMHNVKAGSRVLQISELLQGYVGSARQVLDRALSQAEETSSVYGHKYRESERSVASTIASLRSDKEDMLPSAIYVLVAGLSGSIFTRRSNILLRATVPWIFGAGAFAYFLPETWANVRYLASKYEQETAPGLAKKHAEAQASLDSLTRQTKNLYGESEKQVQGSVVSLRDKIKQWTGF